LRGRLTVRPLLGRTARKGKERRGEERRGERGRGKTQVCVSVSLPLYASLQGRHAEKRGAEATERRGRGRGGRGRFFVAASVPVLRATPTVRPSPLLFSPLLFRRPPRPRSFALLCSAFASPRAQRERRAAQTSRRPACGRRGTNGHPVPTTHRRETKRVLRGHSLPVCSLSVCVGARRVGLCAVRLPPLRVVPGNGAAAVLAFNGGKSRREGRQRQGGKRREG
jgi:hypothetical protein